MMKTMTTKQRTKNLSRSSNYPVLADCALSDIEKIKSMTRCTLDAVISFDCVPSKLSTFASKFYVLIQSSQEHFNRQIIYPMLLHPFMSSAICSIIIHITISRWGKSDIYRSKATYTFGFEKIPSALSISRSFPSRKSCFLRIEGVSITKGSFRICCMASSRLCSRT